MLLLFPSFSTTFLSIAGCFPVTHHCGVIENFGETHTVCYKHEMMIPFAIPSTLIFTYHYRCGQPLHFALRLGGFFSQSYLAIDTTFCYNYNHTNTFLDPTTVRLGTQI